MLQPHWPRSQKFKIGSRLSDGSSSILGWYKWRARKPSALVVDDDPAIPPLVRAALSRYAISSDGVSDGASALTRLRVHTYDLVILDLALVGSTGFDVLRAMRKQTRLRKIPVIVLTANDTDEALARSFGYGAEDFVLKPFSANELGMRAYRLLYPMTAR